MALQIDVINFQVNMHNTNRNLMGITDENITYITELLQSHQHSPGTP